MALGFPGRQLSDLRHPERRAWADRLKGYLIFPSDTQEEQRLRYQACKAANRVKALKEKLADPQKTKRKLARLSTHPAEERSEERRVGKEGASAGRSHGARDHYTKKRKI